MTAPLSPMAMALRFVALSGLGWLCDLVTFTVLVRLGGWDGATANIVSSYAGVTFVWFSSLQTVFRRASSGRFLLLYWGYQFLAILLFSWLLGLLVTALPAFGAWDSHRALAAKLLITPFTLLSNFLFMKALTRYMHPR